MGAWCGSALRNRDQQNSQNAVRFPGGIFLERNRFAPAPCSELGARFCLGTVRRNDDTHKWNRNIAPFELLKKIVNRKEDMMRNHLAVSLIAASLFASGAAFAQSTTATGAADGARTGGEVAGPVGEIVGGTVGAAVGAGLEIPNAVITSILDDRGPSVTVRERVVVGEPLPETVELRPVPRYSEYRYAVVNDRRVIVEPRTRKIIKIID
jgi:hypothetical protein